MASAQNPNRVYFTSLDRSPVDTNTDFSISFDTPIDNSKNFEVVSASTAFESSKISACDCSDIEWAGQTTCA